MKESRSACVRSTPAQRFHLAPALGSADGNPLANHAPNRGVPGIRVPGRIPSPEDPGHPSEFERVSQNVTAHPVSRAIRAQRLP